MKTKNYISTLLALIIHAVIIGQTSALHRTLPILGANPVSSTCLQKQKIEQKETVQKDFTAKSVKNSKKNYSTLISEESHQEQDEIARTNIIDNNTFNYFNNNNCYATIVYAKELLKQADDLSSIEKTLRDEAKTKQGEEKIALIKASSELLKQSEIKRIQASEISGRLSLEKFALNSIVFNNMLFTSVAEEITIDKAKEINSEAMHNFKMAKEMREEAYSMKTNSAKLGTMNNAEEKEELALNEQESAISILKKSTTYIYQIRINDLAVK